MGEFSKVAGAILRRARLSRHLTLHDVSAISGSRFKPSILGSYERGERTLSVDRFCQLAELYAIPPDRLMTELVEEHQPEGQAEVVIDLTKLELVAEPDRTALAGLVDDVRSRRRDYLSDVVTLRSGDVAALALERHVAPSRLLDRIRPALVEPSRS